MVCVDPKDIPVVAFVDPDMMASMPKGLTAATGMDALTHAIEHDFFQIRRNANICRQLLHSVYRRLTIFFLRHAIDIIPLKQILEIMNICLGGIFLPIAALFWHFCIK